MKLLIYNFIFIQISIAISPREALNTILDGNAEYMVSSSYSNIAYERRLYANMQKPLAVVIGCSDSRVPPELIFNQLGLGKIFVVRNAGNIADDIVIGSIEYAVEHLHVPLIVVLGHERCGAVTAAVDYKLRQTKNTGYIQNIIDNIEPIFENIKLPKKITIKQKYQLVEDSIKENIKHTIEQIKKRSELIIKKLASKELEIVGAYYDLDNGSVKLVT